MGSASTTLPRTTRRARRPAGERGDGGAAASDRDRKLARSPGTHADSRAERSVGSARFASTLRWRSGAGRPSAGIHSARSRARSDSDRSPLDRATCMVPMLPSSSKRSATGAPLARMPTSAPCEHDRVAMYATSWWTSSLGGTPIPTPCSLHRGSPVAAPGRPAPRHRGTVSSRRPAELCPARSPSRTTAAASSTSARAIARTTGRDRPGTHGRCRPRRRPRPTGRRG